MHPLNRTEKSIESMVLLGMVNLASGMPGPCQSASQSASIKGTGQVTLPYGKPLPLEAAVEQEQEQLLVRAPGCWSARARTSARTRAPTRARAHCTAVLRYTVLVPYWSNIHRISTIPVRAWGRIYIASARKCPY